MLNLYVTHHHKGLFMRVIISILAFIIASLFILPASASGQNSVSRVYLLEDGIFSFNHDQSISVGITTDVTSLSVGAFFLPDTAAPNMRVLLSRPTAIAEFERVGFGNTPQAILNSRLRLWQQTASNRVASTLGSAPAGSFVLSETQTILINNLTATFATLSYSWDTTQSVAIFIAVLDVGGNHVVTIEASPALGDSTTVLASRQTEIFDLLNSVRFTPNAESVTINPHPLVYMGEIGRLRTGVFTFTYPKDWYILPVGGNVLITNTNQLAINELVSGQIQTQIIPPDFNLTAFADRDQIVNCTIPEEIASQINPQSVIERQMLSPERLASYDSQGVTYIAPQTITIGGRNAAYMTLFTPDRDALVVAVDLGDGNIASLMAFSAPNEIGNYSTDLFSIAASFQYDSSACVNLSDSTDL